MSEEGNTAVWDDSLLVKTYDESVGLAREALARRLADSTNKREEENAATEEAGEDSATGGPNSPEPLSFKVGDYARATYVDGLDYEGAVMTINEEKGTCVIRYLGYENEQEVLLLDLLPSWGKRARREQFLIAKKENDEQPGRSKASPATAGHSKNPKPFGKGRGSAGLVMPPMPPVPPMIAGQGDGAEQDFVAMLTAWYMSGYYTGLYQGKKEANTGAKKKTPKK
ncbi:survival motor neuron protein [Drosophila ficusphila]|uniref:survival motor neuron protein n=1 Tax=Drosophila ficusphila TaxID=30025 RepID=UPI0007E6C27E|nr:survival motor neuron protein [Drosophila ficusphila]